MKKRWFPLIVALVFSLNALLIISSNSALTKKVSNEECPINGLVDGDLVMRNGKGIISSWFRKMSLNDPQFTHAGLVELVNGKPYVVHCRQEGQPEGIVRESLTDFVNKNNCSAYAVYRFEISQQSRDNLRVMLEKDIQRGVTFDEEFNLNNGTREYCTEYVFNRVSLVSGDHNFLPVTKSGDYVYIAPDNLYLNKHAYRIWQQLY